MRKFRILLTAAVMAIGLTLGMAGMASAAQQGGCGWCHGTMTNKFTYGVNTTIDMRSARGGNLAAPYESSLTPQADNDRGLHGIHLNYSSASYGSNGTNTIDGVVYNVRGTCAYCHDNKHQNHEGGFLQWSTISVQLPGASRGDGVNTSNKVITKGFMRYSSDQGGTSDRKNSISSFNASTRTGTCTAACHKGTSSANPARWGNYTTASIKLTCNSCHGDASDYGTGKANNTLGNGFSGNGGHKAHLFSVGGSHADQLLGGTKIVLGSFSTVIDKNGNTNKVCAACHPDNTGEGKTAKDWGPGRFGSSKAYPHATDGTNVKAINIPLSTFSGSPAGIVFTNASGLADTSGKLSCTNNCHSNKSSVQAADPTWTATGGCELCHNHTPSASVNISATRPLSYAHALHFQMISSMHVGGNSGLDQNGIRIKSAGLPSCNDCHTEAHTVNALGGPQLYQIPVKDGAAGIREATEILTTDTHGSNGTFTAVGWSGTGTVTTSGTCTNRCHQYGSPNWNTITTNSTTAVAGCAACHEYPSTNSADAVSTGNPVQPGKDWKNTNGHSTRSAFDQHTSVANAGNSLRHLSKAAAYNKTTDTYAGVTGDQARCGKCHSGGTHMSGTIDVNPGTGAASGFTLTNRTEGSAVQCSNAKCHFNRTTPNWY